MDSDDPASGIDITVDEAVAAAEDVVGGTADRVQVAFAVTIGDRVVFVDAVDGRVMEVGPEPEAVAPPPAGYTVSEGKRHLSRAAITPDEAVAAALTVAEGSVRNIELEWEDGRLLYEVTISNLEVYVDAQTGEVVEVERIFGFGR